MSKAVFRIVAAMEKGEKITVYGDYDVDGITASSLLYMFLKEQGAVVDVYIPKREDEGYGLNSDALQKLFATGTRLLITVDCGVSGNKEVAEVQKGMDIIITDHHTPPKELPAAFAIINPHQNDCRYPFKDLAGVGVAFKLCQGLYKYLTKEEELWTDKIEFAAMGTVADIVPLVGENRELVRLGLKRIKHTKSKGLLELMVKLSRCCNPIPGDPIVGYITRGRGISVHRADCSNILSNREEADRMINVSWDIATDAVYKVTLQVTSADQPGVMANIMMVASESKININSLNVRTDKSKTAIIHMGLDITSLDQLNYIIGRIKRVKGIYNVERDISGVIGG